MMEVRMKNQVNNLQVSFFCSNWPNTFDRQNDAPATDSENNVEVVCHAW